MNGHLITVEVRVECRTNQRVNFDGFAFYQHRLERLNTKPVKRWSAVEKNWMVFDDLFQNVPHYRILPLDHFLCGFHRRAVSALLQAVVDERLEQFERHLLRQAALMEVKL